MGGSLPSYLPALRETSTPRHQRTVRRRTEGRTRLPVSDLAWILLWSTRGILHARQRVPGARRTRLALLRGAATGCRAPWLLRRAPTLVRASGLFIAE
jgi:hypothetical protein